MHDVTARTHDASTESKCVPGCVFSCPAQCFGVRFAWGFRVGFRGGGVWGGVLGGFRVGHNDVRLSSTFFVINAWFESGLFGAHAYACSGSLLWCFPVISTDQL